MTTKKYELLNDDTFMIGLRKLYRIRAIRDISPTILEGMYGGYIESEANLSHEGSSWIGTHAIVMADASVTENAYVHGYAKISGKCKNFRECTCVRERFRTRKR